MTKGISLLDMLNALASKNIITKREFGVIMHDPDSTEEEKQEALRILQAADGYENLAD